MANRLVVRFWPVDGEYSTAPSNGGAFGMSLWAQPVADSYDGGNPTMGVMDGVYAPGDLIHVVDQFTGWTGRYATAVNLSAYEIGGEGEYVEQEVFLLEEVGGGIRSVGLADLPLDVLIAGCGPSIFVEPPSGEDGFWRETEAKAAASYAGGVVEFGLYVDEVFYSLSSFWFKGAFFDPKSDGTSWDNPVLPERTDEVRIDGADGFFRTTLRAGPAPPAPLFWTQLKQAVEV